MKRFVVLILMCVCFFSSCGVVRSSGPTVTKERVIAVDKDGNRVEIEVVSDEETQQKQKEFQEKYPELL